MFRSLFSNVVVFFLAIPACLLAESGERRAPLGEMILPERELVLRDIEKPITVDLGECFTATRVTLPLRLKNGLDREIRLARFESSCGCLTSKSESHQEIVLAPEGCSLVTFRIEVNQKPGVVDRVTRLHFVGPIEPLVVTFRIDGVRPFSVAPVHKISLANETTEFVLRVHRGMGDRLRLVKASSAGQLFVFSDASFEASDEGGIIRVVATTTRKAGELVGRDMDVLHLHFGSGESSAGWSVSVPVEVVGRSAVKVVPRNVVPDIADGMARIVFFAHELSDEDAQGVQLVVGDEGSVDSVSYPCVCRRVSASVVRFESTLSLAGVAETLDLRVLSDKKAELGRMRMVVSQ